MGFKGLYFKFIKGESLKFVSVYLFCYKKQKYFILFYVIDIEDKYDIVLEVMELYGILCYNEFFFLVMLNNLINVIMYVICE